MDAYNVHRVVALMIMDQIVLTSMNVLMVLMVLIEMLAASILLAVTVVNAMLVFKEMAEDATMLMSDFSLIKC